MSRSLDRTAHHHCCTMPVASVLTLQLVGQLSNRQAYEVTLIKQRCVPFLSDLHKVHGHGFKSAFALDKPQSVGSLNPQWAALLLEGEVRISKFRSHARLVHSIFPIWTDPVPEEKAEDSAPSTPESSSGEPPKKKARKAPKPTADPEDPGLDEAARKAVTKLRMKMGIRASVFVTNAASPKHLYIPHQTTLSRSLTKQTIPHFTFSQMNSILSGREVSNEAFHHMLAATIDDLKKAQEVAPQPDL